ncbi:cobalamin biosynthesis protein [Xanthobacter sp. V4C-4]|uniref:cobalamin biosynthesis protein n=1 Tax=Xanthobacter cornucopiae TaxID=3119924 RepID=UPI00372C1993
MIAAGFGMSSAVTAEELLALFAQALAAGGLEAGAVDCLATVALRARLPALREVAARLRLPVRAVAAGELPRVAAQVVTHSERAMARHGVGSVAEAAALAAAGRDARLLVPRLQAGRATCALAHGVARTPTIGEASP